MNVMALDDAMAEACRAVGINPPKHKPVPGQWTRTDTLERNGKGDASVLIFDDLHGGIAWNWQTQQRQPFTTRGRGEAIAPAIRRDPEKERRQKAEQAEVERICADLVRACQMDRHAYLERKGFPTALGLVIEDPRRIIPQAGVGKSIAKALPEGNGPFLIVPGRIGKKVTTLQFITADGAKKNIFRGVMGGASHRIATGRQTWVCEGIATALSVNAALRLLNASATVLCAFAASNVAKVARSIPGAIIAADNDKPVETLGGLGTGEFYARQSGQKWIAPPVLGDFNDFHQSAGLRDVAMYLRDLDMG